MRLYGTRRENGSVIRTYVPSHVADPMELLARIYLGGQLVREIKTPAENYPFGDAAMDDFLGEAKLLRDSKKLRFLRIMRLNRKIMGVLRSLEARKS
ncbi:MAG: hypothetical protein HYU56_02085 [Candidatus Aenigmarchaeota archaeon]|nr:hypothetical protein [Candidatus Aenigmarchaeota archaeon]